MQRCAIAHSCLFSFTNLCKPNSLVTVTATTPSQNVSRYFDDIVPAGLHRSRTCVHWHGHSVLR
jgi:hypothetical protein